MTTPPDHPPEAPQAPGTAPLQIPGDTTPTWELEMLVSGVVIFGLFQLPPLFARGLSALLPRFTGNAQALLSGGLLLAEAAVFALITAFVVHLVSRTFWVALVGLHSVYPEGVRWDRLRRGPMFTEISLARERTLPERIEAVDNFCAVIFAFAFLAAIVVVFGAVLLAVATLVSLGISQVFFGGQTVAQLPVLLILAFAVLVATITRLDRRFGARLAPGSRRARVLRVLVAAVYIVLARPLYGPIFNTLSTNVRTRVMMPLLFGLLFLSFGAAAMHLRLYRGGDLPRALSYVPAEASEQTVDFRSYADQRTGAAARAAVPFIQSDIVRTPYVRLFVPYVPDRDDPTLASCPEATPPGGDDSRSPDARAAGAIRCLAEEHAVELDGSPRPDLDFRFTTDPGSGLLGIVTYISTSSLPRGRHVLTVKASPPAPGVAAELASPGHAVIPFWL